jgi:hypothetical protein
MLIIVLGLISGLLLGITGGGGAIVSVPALVYGLHMPMQIATTMSLFVVGGSALLGTILKRKQVAWGKGLIFAILGSLFSPVGSFLAKRFSESSLIAGFAILMLIVAVLMFKRSNAKSPPLNNLQPSAPKNTRWLVVIVAIFTGLLTGFFGVGGGFMIVPALVLLNKLETKVAAATSLFIISLISISSLANKVAEIELDVKLVLIFMLGSLLGMLAGNYISQKISNKLSQRIFAAISALLGIYMLIDSVLKFAV